MLNAIKNTLRRLLVSLRGLTGLDTVGLLLEGLAVEFGRVVAMKNRVISAVVPNADMDTDAIEDYNDMYGIPDTLGGTDAEQINRIIERAGLGGTATVIWLQEQIQKAGFALYVFPNLPDTANEMQMGAPTPQMSSAYQMGWGLLYDNPDEVLGELIVGSPPGIDTEASFVEGQIWPVPEEFSISDDPTEWGFFLFLSPSADGIVTDPGDLLSLTQREFNYLRKIIISMKHMRTWVIAQVAIS
jgi:hypothetical protein